MKLSSIAGACWGCTAWHALPSKNITKLQPTGKAAPVSSVSFLSAHSAHWPWTKNPKQSYAQEKAEHKQESLFQRSQYSLRAALINPPHWNMSMKDWRRRCQHHVNIWILSHAFKTQSRQNNFLQQLMASLRAWWPRHARLVDFSEQVEVGEECRWPLEIAWGYIHLFRLDLFLALCSSSRFSQCTTGTSLKFSEVRCQGQWELQQFEMHKWFGTFWACSNESFLTSRIFSI